MIKLFLTLMCFILISNQIGYCENLDYKILWSNPIVLPFENVNMPDLSDDGSKLAFIKYKYPNRPDSDSELWLSNSNGTMAKLLSSDNADVSSPKWTSDNNLFFLKNSNYELWELFIGQSKFKPITEKKFEKYSPQISYDGTKLYIGIFGNSPDQPGIWYINLKENTQRLVYSTTALSYKNPCFAVSPDNKIIAILENQNLILLNMDGSIKERRIIKTLLKGNEEPIWSPDSRYIVLNNLLYVLASSEETPFFPNDVVTFKENGKPDLLGPKLITLSRDGKKVAFVMSNSNPKNYIGRIKIMDIVWK